jgi:hypothetical protein
MDSVSNEGPAEPAAPSAVDQRDNGLTYALLVVLGYASLGWLVFGIFDALDFISRGDDSAIRQLVVVAQFGLALVGAATSFGLAQISWNVRNRLVPSSAQGTAPTSR